MRGFAGVCRAVGERTPKILNAVGNGDRGYGDPPGERPDRPARPHSDDQLDLARARHFGHVLPWVFLDSRRSIICYCMRWRDDSCIFSPPQQVGVDSVDPLTFACSGLVYFSGDVLAVAGHGHHFYVPNEAKLTVRAAVGVEPAKPWKTQQWSL